MGNSILPYFIFPGKRCNDDFLIGAVSGSDGEMSINGWSMSSIFQNYIMKHFVKYANVSDTSKGAPTLILYDGHKSHIFLTLADWAKKRNVILLVLPPTQVT